VICSGRTGYLPPSVAWPWAVVGTRGMSVPFVVSPSAGLRTRGMSVPFVVSLSNHERPFDTLSANGRYGME